MALGLMRFVREGIRRKLRGLDTGRSRILVVENPELGFELGPLLARVLGIPYYDSRKGSEIPGGRCVVSGSLEIPHRRVVDLNGNFGEYLLEGMTRGVDIRIEALKISLQQLTMKKKRF